MSVGKKPRKPLPRYKQLRSSGRRIKPKKRSAATFARVYGSTARIAWMKAMSCLVCPTRPSEIAHVRTGGMGRKASAAETVPLCHTHHRMQHALSIRSFERVFAVELGGLTLADWAAKYDAHWGDACA